VNRRQGAAFRLGRLDGEAAPVIRTLRVGQDHLPDWLTPQEFDELAELVKVDGLPFEADACQALLRRAWGRRARKEPRATNLVGVLFEEGRSEEAEEEIRRRRAWGLDRP
jgi:hypothetical protein